MSRSFGNKQSQNSLRALFQSNFETEFILRTSFLIEGDILGDIEESLFCFTSEEKLQVSKKK